MWDVCWGSQTVNVFCHCQRFGTSDKAHEQISWTKVCNLVVFPEFFPYVLFLPPDPPRTPCDPRSSVARGSAWLRPFLRLPLFFMTRIVLRYFAEFRPQTNAFLVIILEWRAFGRRDTGVKRPSCHMTPWVPSSNTTFDHLAQAVPVRLLGASSSQTGLFGRSVGPPRGAPSLGGWVKLESFRAFYVGHLFSLHCLLHHYTCMDSCVSFHIRLVLNQHYFIHVVTQVVPALSAGNSSHRRGGSLGPTACPDLWSSYRLRFTTSPWDPSSPVVLPRLCHLHPGHLPQAWKLPHFPSPGSSEISEIQLICFRLFAPWKSVIFICSYLKPLLLVSEKH